MEEKSSRRKRGSTVASNPPSVQEVGLYCLERQNGIDPQVFHDYYTANGWVQGSRGKPLVDWKAAVRLWESKRRESPQPQRPRMATNVV